MYSFLCRYGARLLLLQIPSRVGLISVSSDGVHGYLKSVCHYQMTDQ